MEKLFFQLLQVALGNRKELTHTPSADEWQELYAMSMKQALSAVAFRGVSNLKEASKDESGASPSLDMNEMLYLRWLGMTAKVAQRNRTLNKECANVCKEFAHDGVLSVVLKGQSNLVYYPESLRECRTPGDIDLWCDILEGVEVAHEVGGSTGSPTSVEKREYRGIEGVIEYCQQYERCQGREIPWHRVLYYHCELTSPSGIGIEPHYRPTYLNSPIRNWRLQRWFRENEPWGMCDAKIDGYVFSILPVSTNVIYQLLHINKHLFEEGIGLRQLLDYYFVLRALHIEQGELYDRTQSMAQWAEGMGIAVASNMEIMHTLGRFGMKKFAGAVMYVLQTVFAMPDEYLICQANEKEGRFLLNEIMMAGNFGKYDTRISHSTSQMGHAWEKLKHNFRLIRHYPEEVMWEPVFRVYHWVWRKLELWKF